MKTITAIIGSPKRNNSTTYQIVESLYKTIDSYGIKYRKSIILLSNYEVDMCKGCAQCFFKCHICEQFDDDLKYIEEQILDSDIIIFASPVYAHNIAGIMKNFIDRISYGLHIMRYLGKIGLTISVSDSNGNAFVDDYLEKILLYLGVKVVDRISIKMVKGIDYRKISDCAQNIAQLLNGDNIRTATEYEELVFKTMRNALYDISTKMETNETMYWKKHGYFEFNSFEEAFSLEVKQQRMKEKSSI